MKDIMHTLIVRKGESFKQSHLEIPDVWQNRPREWASIFRGINPDTIVLLIPTTQVEKVVSLLNQHSAS